MEPFWIPKRNVSAVVVVLVVVVFFIILNPLVQIGAGERGVVLNFGAFDGQVMNPGLHWRTPIVQRVVQMDVQTQAYSVEAWGATKDLNDVHTEITLNYHLNPEQVGTLYQNIGSSYQDRIIVPAVQESVKAITALHTAEELVTKRAAAKAEFLESLKVRLATSYIVADDISITDFDFSESFNAAIEAKVTAEQNALAAKNKLEQVKFEAQQAIEQAKAQAESIRIQGDALRNNPQLVELKAVERWDGKLPMQMIPGGALPFINLN